MLPGAACKPALSGTYSGLKSLSTCLCTNAAGKHRPGPIHCALSLPPINVPTCRAFYVAAFACVYFSHWSNLVCILAAIWAIFTALSRAAMGRHYIGDICAGMPLGLLTVAVVTKVIVLMDQMMNMSHDKQMFPVPWQLQF